MKTKNVILGLAALVFAIGSAFTSLEVGAPDFISVQYEGNPLPDFECVQISQACNGTAQDPLCKIQVKLSDNSIVAAQVYDLDSNEILCTTALRDANGSIGSYPTTGQPIHEVKR
jgi:hypothetical protein